MRAGARVYITGETLWEVFMEVYWVPLVIIAVIAIAVISLYVEAQRSRAFRELAARLGLRYRKSGSDLLRQFSYFDVLRRGHSRKIFNVLEGPYQGHEVCAFDFRYTTGSGKNQQTYHLSFFMLRLPREFPEVRIYPENFLSKIGQAIGFEDIDFESVEFSRAFTVRAQDKKIAYDICHTRMMEYLLAHPKLSLEIERDWLASAEEKRIKPEEVPARLEQLVEICALFPDYLCNP
jgi:hypothetical protein